MQLKYILCSKSRYKCKHTDCFNDPAFIELFSKLRVDADCLNKPNPAPKPSPSSQVGLATPPDTSINLPYTVDGSSSTLVDEGNTVQVLHDSTREGSCNSTPQARVPIPGVPAHPLVTAPAESMTSSGASYRKKKKFYVVTRGRHTGVFDNW